MKNKLIYNLGRRGFFSEINNMVLAKIYAERHNLEFMVNSYYWNCRYKEGMRDYFDNEIQEQNNFLSAQISRNKPILKFNFDLHSVFYNISYVKNFVYQLLNKEVLLGADIYEEIRSNDFRESIDSALFMYELYNVIRLKASIYKEFENIFNQLGIDEPFCGVHIRRGDKITTGEMDNIPLNKYALEVTKTSLKSIYIATDDVASVYYFKEKMASHGIRIYYNPTLKGTGFSEGSFNHAGKKIRYDETLTLLFDIFVLSKASKFIGTYSSNLSRVIPCLLGLDNCKSLDDNWFIG